MGNSVLTIVRNGFYRFPAVFAVVMLGLGIVYEVYGNRSIQPWSLVALVPALAFLFLAMVGDRQTFLWIAAGFFFFLFGQHICREQVTWGDDFRPSRAKCIIHASVHSLWASGDGFRILLVEDGWDATAGKSLPGYGRLIVRQNDIPLFAGDRVSFRALLRKPINRGNPGEYDWETDCRHNGIIWLASVEGPDSFVVIRRGLDGPQMLLSFELATHWLISWSRIRAESWAAIQRASPIRTRQNRSGLFLRELWWETWARLMMDC